MARRSGWSVTAASRQASRFKWGTGINPVHSVNIGDEGRNYSVNQTAGGTHTPQAGFAEVPLEITDAYYYVGADAESSPWTDIPSEYDQSGDSQIPHSPIYGYTDDAGLSDRPVLGMNSDNADFRGSTEMLRGRGWPSWGPYSDGVPGGTNIRDQNHGADVTKNMKVNPNETVTEGWRNKERLDQEFAADGSDVAQVFRQTSYLQRMLAREGSQRGEGSQSVQEPAHAISSRTAPPKVKPWSGEERHYDMTPRVADEIVKPWWSRGAGTAPPVLLEPNQQLPIDPLVRNPPPDPYQGGDVQATADNPSGYGYSGEDFLPYV